MTETFTAQPTTHPNRAQHDGKAVVRVVHHFSATPALAAEFSRLRNQTVEAGDIVQYAVFFADGTDTWATAREIGRS